MNLKELRQSRADKGKAGRDKTTEYNALGAKSDRTAEDDTRMTALDVELNAIESDCADLDAKIAAEEKATKRGALFASTAQTTAGGGRSTYVPARTVNETDPERTAGFKNLAEFAGAVVQTTLGHHDARLSAAASTYNANQGTAGEGYLVPPEYSQEVWDMAFTDADLLGMSQPEPTSSNAIIKPKDETTPWGAAGVQAAWAAEGATLTPSKAQITGEMMQLHKLFAFVVASDEILSDAPMLQSRLTKKAGQAISWTASDAIMWGNGVGKPLGIMNSSALITVAKDSGQPAATISISNLANMIARVLRIGGKPLWLAHTSILPQLIQLTLGNAPAYLPNNAPLNNAQSPFDGYLLGYPIMFSEHAQVLGTPGDLTCINLAGYYSATKTGGVQYDTSIHLYFDQGLQAFRWTFRIAGQPYLSTPVSPARGSLTKSHFVTLAAR